MTNAEKIRSLSDAELAMFLDGWETGEIPTTVFFCCACGADEKDKKCWKCMGVWLSEDADEKEYATLFEKKK